MTVQTDIMQKYGTAQPGLELAPLGVKEVYMDIAKKAWTTDGYLDYQEQMRNIPYGKYTIGEKGCGFIAAFNICGSAVGHKYIPNGRIFN